MASIGFTLALIAQGYGPNGLLEYLLLVLSWISFLITIILVHKAYKYSASLAKAVIDEEDALYSGFESEIENARERRRLFDMQREIILRWAYGLFYAGIFTALIFVTVEFAVRR